MAEVYLAKCFGVAGFERLVALKRILPTIAEDDEFIAMFIDEAKIAGQLSHANVAQIFDLGKINASYFIAMEYISGHDLRALWDRARDDGGLPLGLACYVTRKICEGLDYAHRRRDNRGRPLGIIHRDVSPQNILLSYNGDTKVIDFGIAKAANRMVRTQTGILKGKFAYMAPEQARGEPTDHRADIFAIGVILYELITGERCFKAESDFALLEKVRRVDIIPPRKIKSNIPRDLERIVFKALAREAGDRYAWASALAADLDHFMDDQSLAYNKDELGAYVRRMFREEHSEETRRLAQYRSFKLREDADGEEELYSEMQDEDVSRVDEPASLDDQRTFIAQDPSLEPSASEAPAGATLVGDAVETHYPYDEESIEGQPTAQMSGHRLASMAASFDEGDDLDESRTIPGEELSLDAANAIATSLAKNGASDSSQANSENGKRADATMVEGYSTPDTAAAPSSLGSVIGADAESAGSGRADSARRPATRPRLSTKPRPATERHRVADARSGDESASSSARSLTPSEGYDVVGPYGVSDEFAGPPRASAPTPPNLGGIAAASIGFGVVLGGIATAITIFSMLPAAPDTAIQTTPPGAKIMRGDDEICKTTPCLATLGEGSHALKFAVGKQTPVTRTVKVGPAFTMASIPLTDESVALRVVTDPPGAKVTLNNRAVAGTTPLSLPKLAAGEKARLKVERKGYETIEEIYVVPETDSGFAPLELKANETRWTIFSEPADAIVIPAGNRWGFRKKATVAVRHKDAHAVRVQRPGCEPEYLSVIGTGKPEAERTVKLKCRDNDSKLRVIAPRKAAILIDGVSFSARDARNYELPAGSYGVICSYGGRQEAQVLELKKGEVTKATFFR